MKFIKHLHQWHRRSGIFAALILLMLAVTGLLLNHTSDLALAQKQVRSKVLLKWYGITPPEVRAQHLNKMLFVHDGMAMLYADGGEEYRCDAPFLGGVQLSSGELILQCGDGLLWLMGNGRLVERISGLPGIMVAEGLHYGGEGLWLKQGDRALKLDLDNLDIVASKKVSELSSDVNWYHANSVAPQDKGWVKSLSLSTGLDWERVLLDLHSGRILGTLGVWLVDAAAILTIILAFTGLYIWLWRRRRRR